MLYLLSVYRTARTVCNLNTFQSTNDELFVFLQQGMDKKFFVNDVTSAAIKTLQVIDWLAWTNAEDKMFKL